MYSKGHDTTYPRIVATLCIAVLGIILVAGLWPFRASENQVSWRKGDGGLVFGGHGSVVSAGTFPGSASNDDSTGSIEIWLEPSSLENKRTILSFDSSDHPGAPFSLHQYKDALVVHQHNVDDHGTVRTAWFEVDHFFRDRQPVFVTVTLAKGSTSVYRNGILAKVFSVEASTKNLSGRLVVANASRYSDSWSGQLLGLAIYHRQLTSAQIVQHYENWTKNGRPLTSAVEDRLALYLFNEGSGDIVHDQADDAETDLVIPKRYFVLHPAFLSSPWSGYHATWGYWQDVVVNIAGFIPFGFCIVAYLHSVRRTKRPATTTIILAFATSLTIEVLQAFLPSRDSGATDLITNTLGTTIGVVLYRWPFAQSLLTHARQLLPARDGTRPDASGGRNCVRHSDLTQTSWEIGGSGDL